MGTLRKSRNIPFAAVLLSVLLSAADLHSQAYLTQNYSYSDGLASATVNAIGQDTRGVMWFATVKGVTSYDGAAWKNYTKSDGLDFTAYYHLATDKQGNTWAFTDHPDRGFSCFTDGRWRQIDGPPKAGSDPKEIHISEVALLEYQDKIFIGIGTQENGFYLYRNPGWQHFPVLAAIRNVACYRDTFYLATEQGLQTISPLEQAKTTLENLNTPSKEIYTIAIDVKNTPGAADTLPVEPLIWLTGYRWVGYYWNHRFRLVYKGDFPELQEPYYHMVTVTLPDGYGGVWAACPAALLKVDPGGSIRNFTNQNDLPGDGAYCLFYDRESNLWIGGFRGVSKIVSFRFANFREKQGLYGDEVAAITEKSSSSSGGSEIVLGHKGGFSFLSEEKIDTLEIPGIHKDLISSYRVLDIDVDPQGNTWAAVTWTGIIKITPGRRVINYTIHGDPRERPTYSSVRVDHTGAIWASVNNSLYVLKDNRLTLFRTDPPIDAFIRRIFKGTTDQNGNWETLDLGTSWKGLYRLSLNDHRLTRFLSSDGDSANDVFAAWTDKENRTWVGTAAGLYTLNVENNRLEKYSNARFRVDNPVYFITEDHDHNLWLGLDDGVIRWNISTGAVQYFTPRDGLAGHETNRSAGFVDHKGRVWIGTATGLSRYDKEKDNKEPVPPLLELVGVETSGVMHPLISPVSLTFQQNDLTFNFRGISFSDEKNLRYHLKLEGYDNHWIQDFHSMDNQVRYTNLSPGRYTFHIQAVNSSGLKSRIVSSNVITIKNPLWKTPLFYLLMVIILAGLFFNTAKYLSKKRYAAHLEQQVNERTRELEESRTYFSNIFENAHDAIIIFLPDDEVILDINRRGCELYGFDRSELIGMSLESISKNVEQGKKRIREVLEKGKVFSFETTQYRKDGSEMSLEINASVIESKGQKLIISINRDITERKRTEQQIKNSLKEKEVLLKEIHHRVKNNLQIISSLVDLQAGALEDERIIRVFQDSKSRIRAMAMIHENLYRSDDLARVDMADYIEALVGHFWGLYGTINAAVTPSIRVENISLGIDIAIPIGLILTELFSNALKYAFPNGREGEIHIQLKRNNKDTITLIFKDNGVGFPAGMDVHNPRSLGLQLVNLLVQQISGTIEYDGSAGASFNITLLYPSNAPTGQGREKE